MSNTQARHASEVTKCASFNQILIEQIKRQYLVRAACRDEHRLVPVLFKTPSLDALLLLQHAAVPLCQIEGLHEHSVCSQVHTMTATVAYCRM